MGQIEKLPMWAQRLIDEKNRKIQSLEDEKEHLIASIGEKNGEKETNVFIRHLLDEIPLPKNSNIIFKSEKGKISVRHKNDGSFILHSEGKVMRNTIIKPNSSNSFDIDFI